MSSPTGAESEDIMKTYKIFTHDKDGNRNAITIQSNMTIKELCRHLVKVRKNIPLYGITSICRIYGSGNQSAYYEIWNESRWMHPYGGAY